CDGSSATTGTSRSGRASSASVRHRCGRTHIFQADGEEHRGKEHTTDERKCVLRDGERLSVPTLIPDVATGIDRRLEAERGDRTDTWHSFTDIDTKHGDSSIELGYMAYSSSSAPPASFACWQGGSTAGPSQHGQPNFAVMHNQLFNVRDFKEMGGL